MPSTRQSKSLAVFAFVCAHSLAVYGSPVQNGKLHQSFRRERSNNGRIGAAVPLGVSIALVLLIILGCIKGSMIKRQENREGSNIPQELMGGQRAEPIGNPSIARRGQSSNAPGTGRTRQARQRPPESSMHPLPAYAKEPGESEQTILHEMGALPTSRRLDNVVEEGGSSTGDPQQFRRPSYSVPANPPSLENRMTGNSSSPNSLTNSHTTSGSRMGTRVETVDDHNSATSNLRGEAPPPYIEVVGQREVDHR